MKWQLSFLALTLIKPAFTIELENNACNNYISYTASASSPDCYYNPDVLSNITNIVEGHGYNWTKHVVTTNDGYIINLYRISSPNITETKYPVFILHGILTNAESWVMTGNKSLALKLVDQEYDVWVGTVRGTMNSDENTNFSINDPEYWSYNLDTLAKEDVPTQMNFIANMTEQKVLIVAHSMGTTLSFMYTSKNTDNANQVVKGVVALAPIAYLNGVVFVEAVKDVGFLLIEILQNLKIYGILYPEDVVHDLEITVCKLVPTFCGLLVSTLQGFTIQFPPEDLLLFLSYSPSGTSIFQLKQYLQMAQTARFQKFDYGSNQNLKIYGTEQPPVYNLSNIQVPVCLFYGKHDVFYREQNIKQLFNEIGSGIKFETAIPVGQNPEYDFAHIDFVDSKNVGEFLYTDLLAKMEQYFG